MIKTILRFFDLLDRYLWDYKVSETGFKYLGVDLDYHFESFILSIDYMGVDYFFEENGDLEFQDFIELKKQYQSLDIKKRLKLIENVLIVLNLSTNSKETNQKLINRITNILKRDFVRVDKDNSNNIVITQDDIMGEGSYCNVFRVNDFILRKELKDEYDEKIKIIKDVVKGIAFAYEKLIIHRDLYLGNILKFGNDFVILD